MPHWAILRATGEAEVFSDTIYRELEGSEAEALAAMLDIVDTFGQAASEKSAFVREGRSSGFPSASILCASTTGTKTRKPCSPSPNS